MAPLFLYFLTGIDFIFSYTLKLIIFNYMNVTTNTYSSVNHQLRELTQNYLSTHSGLTLNALAQRSGVAATTLRRLMQEESKNELAPHSVLALLSYLVKEKRISVLLKNTVGPVGELLRKNFDQFIFDEKSSDHQLSMDLNLVLKDKTNYLIYKLAANQCGTSIAEIKNLLGLLGLEKLNTLIEDGWIFADSSERLHAKEKNFSLDLVTAHTHAHTLLDQYKPQDLAKGMNLFYSLSEGMSTIGIKKIKEIEKDAVKKIHEVMNDQEMLGEIPYFALILSDILGISSSNQSGVLQ